jgi:hypothetical protein
VDGPEASGWSCPAPRNGLQLVIVDLSSLAPIVDVHATTNLADSCGLIIERGRTRIDVVEHAVDGDSRQEFDDNLRTRCGIRQRWHDR